MGLRITPLVPFFYQILRWVLDALLSPTPPPPHAHLKRPKIAVIGAGLTGVSAASHCVGHGFDCRIFEAGSRRNLGGIWTKVNSTSSLQIRSTMYRFRPFVKRGKGYPGPQQIVSQVSELWERYGLESKTSFNTRVEKVYKDAQGQWIINSPSNGRFDGVVAAVGSCGDPKMPTLPGQEHFKGKIYHSSQLHGKRAKGKKVAIIGGGASAVEALEFVASENAEHTSVLSRSEIDEPLAMNILGPKATFSWIPEHILQLFFYRGPYDSEKGIFTETPMVNNSILDLVRSGKADWLYGDVLGYDESSNGIKFKKCAQGVPKNGPGTEMVIEADIVIMATGYNRPSLGFLPDEVFTKPYDPPNWYLQVFPPENPEICCNNCTYVNAVGTAGNYHVGIYTRFLLMCLVDPLVRPRTLWMKRWIDITRFIKARAPGDTFDFFIYAELIYWFLFTLLFNPFRWKWAAFVLFGIGNDLPLKVVGQEDRTRHEKGMRNASTNHDEGMWMGSSRQRNRKS